MWSKDDVQKLIDINWNSWYPHDKGATLGWSYINYTDKLQCNRDKIVVSLNFLSISST